MDNRTLSAGRRALYDCPRTAFVLPLLKYNFNIKVFLPEYFFLQLVESLSAGPNPQDPQATSIFYIQSMYSSGRTKKEHRKVKQTVYIKNTQKLKKLNNSYRTDLFISNSYYS